MQPKHLARIYCGKSTCVYVSVTMSRDFRLVENHL